MVLQKVGVWCKSEHESKGCERGKREFLTYPILLHCNPGLLQGTDDMTSSTHWHTGSRITSHCTATLLLGQWRWTWASCQWASPTSIAMDTGVQCPGLCPASQWVVVGMKHHAAHNRLVRSQAVSENQLYHMNCCYIRVVESVCSEGNSQIGQLIYILSYCFHQHLPPYLYLGPFWAPGWGWFSVSVQWYKDVSDPPCEDLLLWEAALVSPLS